MKLFTIGLLFSALAYGETQVYKGEATKDGKLVYFEKHTVELQDKKVISSTTEYTDSTGRVLGTLKNNYLKSLNAPEHEMNDPIHKNSHGVRYDGEKLVMFNKDAASAEQTEVLAKNDTRGKLVVGGQGLHYYLTNNMEEVIKKGKLDLKFLIPGRLDAYNFYLKVVKKEEDKVHFDIEIDNWFLKLFAPKLKLIYSIKNPRLIRYSGLSNITDSDKKMMNVEIVYKYDN